MINRGRCVCTSYAKAFTGTAFNTQHLLNKLDTQISVLLARAKGIFPNRRPLEASQYKSSIAYNVSYIYCPWLRGYRSIFRQFISIVHPRVAVMIIQLRSSQILDWSWTNSEIALFFLATRDYPEAQIFSHS